MSLRRIWVMYLLALVLSQSWADATDVFDGSAAGEPDVATAETRIDPAGIRGSLIIGGGGRLDDSIMDRFIELAGGKQAKLVVIPTASARFDESDAESYLESWRIHQPRQLTLLHTRDRDQANSPEFIKPLKDATAVWISGGSQSRIADAYLGTAVEHELHALLDRKGVIGGTSAGAAIMSRRMIASGKTTPVIKMGLGLLPGAIIDQHFLARQRQQRSMQAVADHPNLFGLGIDESTAVEVQGRKFRVLGDSVATLILAASDTRPQRLISLSQGDRADLTALRRAAMARARRPTFPNPKTHVPSLKSGSLLIVGGGKVNDQIADRFVELAGGRGARIVVLPTAASDAVARRKQVPSFLSQREVQSVTVLPHRSRQEVASNEFSAALGNATGIWFGGGRQWRFVDAYEGTPAVALFREVLHRGGVIGGSSAGASIQAEYMVRGDPLGNEVMMAEGYERGLNFLSGVAIDQHLSQRGRLEDLQSVVDCFPQLLGIGIDESTAIVVRESTAEVIGDNDVFFLDASNPESAQTRLSAGEIFDLQRRRAGSPAR